MSQRREAKDDEADRVAIEPLAPRAAWTAGLAAIGREAARRREEDGSFAAGLASTGRWFLPLAAAVALACWVAQGLSPRAHEHGSPSIAAGSEQEALLFVTLGAGR